MNHLKSYTGFVNEARFNFGKTEKDASPNRELLKKQRQQILQKLSAIKHQIAKNNAKPHKTVELPKGDEVQQVQVQVEMDDEVNVPETAAAVPTATLNRQLESLRQELRKVNKLLS